MVNSYPATDSGWRSVAKSIKKAAEYQRLLSSCENQITRREDRTTFWPEQYPEIRAAADKIYLSQEMGMRKPEARIYQALLQEEGFSAEDAVFFDDNADNIEGANQLGITSILVTDKATVPTYFAKQLC